MIDEHSMTCAQKAPVKQPIRLDVYLLPQFPPVTRILLSPVTCLPPLGVLANILRYLSVTNTLQPAGFST